MCLLLAGACGTVAAGDWTIVPRVGADTTFSDNIGLQPSGMERDELVTSIEPGLFVRGRGARLQFDLEYNLEALRYQRGIGRDVINHQAQANGRGEWLEKIGFIDVSATRSQQNTNNFGVTASDNLATTGNSSEVITFSASPYVEHRFGDFMRTEARFTFDRVINETGATETRSDSRNVSLSAQSGVAFDRVPWNVQYTTRRIENSNGSTTRFRTLQGEVRYRFTRKYGVVARLGHERNEFPSSQPGRDGRFWSVGATWTPTERTSIEAGYGRRFFDQNFFLEASHRARRFSFSASYSEDVTTSRQLQLERVLVPLEDPAGNPILDPVLGTQIEVPVDSVNSTDEVLVLANFQGQVTYTGKRTTGTLSIFTSERTFEVSGNEDTVQGMQLRVSHRMSRQGTLTANALAQVSESAVGTGQRDTRLRGEVRYSHQLGKNFRTTVGVSRVQQDSNVASNEYEENRVTAGVVATF